MIARVAASRDWHAGRLASRAAGATRHTRGGRTPARNACRSAGMRGDSGPKNHNIEHMLEGACHTGVTLLEFGCRIVPID
ncbi:hypothetical protein [Burkholderia multivorans]|uniref:hypothetical protein n=1 Tax=Burkholderia multivorans TaxID=87883 RepID=UPI0019D02766|nr:hypothetical protein [Burkholderia multivorans]MBN6729276.1 hypothetical protein [Burkholderia multivorans]MBN6737167.1 hypothetical protein [Burkholderia multivorans]MBN7125821.1 hypothetical protein [Burkholderia multivorans]MBN8161938.1 hypothetical protein [Burkholderia multivorans]MBN8167615.1 hypothetical protein [Burkholderia multivorans]